jgi:hypothetical protein
MKIFNLRPARDGSSALARFDLELSDQVRLFGLILKRNVDGHFRVFAPKSGGTHAATFGPEISNQIIAAAQAAYEGISQYEKR